MSCHAAVQKREMLTSVKVECTLAMQILEMQVFYYLKVLDNVSDVAMTCKGYMMKFVQFAT